MTSAQWLSSTYINSDSERIAAKANERSLTQLNSWIEQAAKFDGKPMSEDSKRAIHLLKLMSSMPAPRDPAKLAELTQIATRMEGSYGAGKYCTDANDPNSCRQLGELEQVLARSRDYDKQLDAWQGWHSTTKSMRGDYQKFVGLVNEGAKGMG
ncbi:M2 family metallopeptidase, partial [Enterobacter hormaechei]